MKRALALLGLIAAAGAAHAYPLDGAEPTGIARLEAYRLAQEGKVQGRKLPKGAPARSTLSPDRQDQLARRASRLESAVGICDTLQGKGRERKWRDRTTFSHGE